MKKKSINKILKWFSMMENEKYKFPKSKKELFQLKELYLCCLCDKVPKEISKLKNIKKLVIELGGIDGPLPKEIKYFKYLEELNLGITNINKLHINLYKLKRLKRLDLSGNFFNDIPKGISSLKNLEELNLLLYCGKLPKDITKLKKLEIITLDTKEVKESIEKMKNVHSLNSDR